MTASVGEKRIFSPLRMPRFATTVLLTWSAWTAGVADAKAVEPIYGQSFDRVPSGVAASAAGFTVSAMSEQSEWTVRDGYLHALMHHKPYNGGYITATIPKVAEGRLDFRVWLGSNNYHHCGFQVRIYGLSTYYHGYGSTRMSWRRYAARYTDGVERDQDVVLQSRIAPGQWHACRIEWNAVKGTILYYVDDMENPCYADAKVAVFSAKEEENHRIYFGNYGLCSGDIEARVDDIKLYPSEAARQSNGRRSNVIVVDGFDYARYRVREAFAAYQAGRVIHFPMVLGAGERAKNTSRLDKIITVGQLAAARLFIMANAPALCLEDETRRELLDQVDQGGLKMLLFGGLFSLGKGQYEGTTFERLCPVGLKGKWSVKEFSAPRQLAPVPGAGFGDLDWSQKPAVLFYHDVTVPPDAEVWVKAGDVPMLAVRKTGRGHVAAFLAAPIGRLPPAALPYWQWEDWPRLVRAICEKLMERQ